MEKSRRNFIFIAIFLLAIWDHIQRASSEEHFSQSPRYRYATDINSDLNEFSEFASLYKHIDLNRGAADYSPPHFLKEALLNVALAPGFNQYSRFSGHERLVKAIAKIYSGLVNQQLDPMNNVIVTIGASEALFIAIQSVTTPGSEWIVFEPFYDRYLPMIAIAEGVPRLVQLRPIQTNATMTSADWKFDRDEYASLFNNNTKGIVLNNPHSPTGKVFTPDELQFIADLAIEHDVVVVVDEVYEWLIYEPDIEHVRIASLPGMFERTITISSASKTFLVPGWRIGWAYGPANLINYMKSANEYAVLCNTTPLQEALARVLEQIYNELGNPDSYLKQLPRKMKAKRDYFLSMYDRIGMTSWIPQGGYFMVTDWTGMKKRPNLSSINGSSEDVKFAKWMVMKLGIEVFPVSLSYVEKDKNMGVNLIRTCFVKSNETLETVDEIWSEYESVLKRLERMFNDFIAAGVASVVSYLKSSAFSMLDTLYEYDVTTSIISGCLKKDL